MKKLKQFIKKKPISTLDGDDNETPVNNLSLPEAEFILEAASLGLRVAAIHKATGAMKVGKPGDMHADLADPGVADPYKDMDDNYNTGFVDKKNQFMTRQQATLHMMKKRGIIPSNPDKVRPLHSYHLGVKMNRIKENTRDQIMNKTRVYFNKKITDKQLRNTGQTNSVMSEAKINDEIHYNTSVPHLKRIANHSRSNEARWVLTHEGQLHAADAYNFNHYEMAHKNDTKISGIVFGGKKPTYLAFHGQSSQEVREHPLLDKFKEHGMKLHPDLDENLIEAVLTGHKSPHPLTLHIDKDYEELHRYSVKHKGKEVGFLNYNVPHNNVAWTKVEPKYRGQGIAMAMHKAVEKENGRPLSPADEYTEAGRAFATKFHGKDVAQGYKKDTAGKYIKESEESERKIHQNPGIGTMKHLTKNSKSGTMKFYISSSQPDANMYVGDSQYHTHNSLGHRGSQIHGAVTYHPKTNEYKYYAKQYKGEYEHHDVTHPRLVDYEKHGITRGKWDMNNAIVESVDENGVHHNTSPSRLMALAKKGNTRFVIDDQNKLHAGHAHDLVHMDLSHPYTHRIRGFITHHPDTNETYFAAHNPSMKGDWNGPQPSARHPILDSLESRGAKRGIVVGWSGKVRAPKGREVPMQPFKWVTEVTIPNITSEDFIVTKGKPLREVIGTSITMALFLHGVVYVYNFETIKFIVPCDQLISFTSGNVNVRVGNYILTYDNNGVQRSLVAIK